MRKLRSRMLTRLILIMWLCWPKLDPSSLADLGWHAPHPWREDSCECPPWPAFPSNVVLNCLDFSRPLFGLELLCCKDFQVSQFWMQYKPWYSQQNFQLATINWKIDSWPCLLFIDFSEADYPSRNRSGPCVFPFPLCSLVSGHFTFQTSTWNGQGSQKQWRPMSLEFSWKQIRHNFFEFEVLVWTDVCFLL